MAIHADMTVRRLCTGEEALLRELRLRALRDAPEQFGERLEHALARSAEDWTALTERLVAPSTQVAFVAERAGQAVGFVYALHDAACADVGRVAGMWVAPEHRRCGVGLALLVAVRAWAAELGKRALGLWVAEDGAAGRALYAKAGFRPTGVKRPFPGSEARVIVEMELVL